MPIVAEGWDTHVHVFEAGRPVRPGHYQPEPAPLADIERAAAAQGIGHLVIVQPSVYGSDHGALLAALQAEPGRHRGVAVADASLDDATLDRWHAAGVRGLRFNRVSPAGHGGDAHADLMAQAPRLRERGWHCQWYVSAGWLPQLVHWQRDSGLDFVLDHLGGLHADLPPDDAAWRAIRALADSGRCWVKLSGWYRLGDEAPYDRLVAHVARLAAWFGPRLLWGSDWPHTSLPRQGLPSYASLLQPARQALGDVALHAALVDAPAVLYR